MNYNSNYNYLQGIQAYVRNYSLQTPNKPSISGFPKLQVTTPCLVTFFTFGFIILFHKII